MQHVFNILNFIAALASALIGFHFQSLFYFQLHVYSLVTKGFQVGGVCNKSQQRNNCLLWLRSICTGLSVTTRFRIVYALPKASDVNPELGLKQKCVLKLNTNPSGVGCIGISVVNFSFLQLFVCIKEVSEYLRMGGVFLLF